VVKASPVWSLYTDDMLMKEMLPPASVVPLVAKRSDSWPLQVQTKSPKRRRRERILHGQLIIIGKFMGFSYGWFSLGLGVV
jgi:hypothetical protein